MMILYYASKIYLNNHTSASKYVLGMFLIIKYTCLIRSVINYILSMFKGIFINYCIIAAYKVSPCGISFINKFLIHIRANPVIAVYKANPFTASCVKACILSSALFLIIWISNNLNLIWIISLVFFKYG